MGKKSEAVYLEITEQKLIILKIKNVDYRLNVNISMGFLKIILEEKIEEEYKNRIAQALLNAIKLDKTEEKPTLEDILEEGSIVLQQYIKAIIKSDKIFATCYAKRSTIEPKYERFCNAIICFK